ncbi:hypothetical protein DACRYDRAFT_23435 [Dacryopinax primogenitus]|uniref:Uncharacterized protein n=1 Tax=Dacryopinax primogenitus (strain DJM 731) TaxID=1858805 RepID=M5G1U6_DACPD|nr:uncharacterized protein DACRYDRAFT_23435 [Dacryopinax primogenitus]EJT99871.1 hypothetical protein DACRYDRAFT_23435 [Dacryopinax primogenitus]
MTRPVPLRRPYCKYLTVEGSTSCDLGCTISTDPCLSSQERYVNAFNCPLHLMPDSCRIIVRNVQALVGNPCCPQEKTRLARLR